jgi:DNA-3-methyladenine glycosylase II
LTADSLTAAVTVDGRPTTFTIRDGAPPSVEVANAAVAPAVLARATDLVGARDEVSELYAAARHDPPFQRLVELLYGLHHVRFLTLEEIAVYSVMMQRTPIKRAATMKRRFMQCFGVPVEVAGTTLYALPAIEALTELDGEAIGKAIGHASKGAIIATVLRGVADIGERFLREAPYAEARDALLEIRGIGPFSAAAILLRGLGRMDELPNLDMFADTARELYGAAFDPTAIRARYGRQVGTWSFYLKTGVARLCDRSAHEESRSARNGASR